MLGGVLAADLASDGDRADRELASLVQYVEQAQSAWIAKQALTLSDRPAEKGRQRGAVLAMAGRFKDPLVT